MNPWTMLASLLKQLPAPVRRGLYTIVTAAGAVLAIAQLAGWKTLAGIDVDTAMQYYALVASPTGVLALANVDGKQDSYAGFGGGGRHEAFDDWDGWDGFAGFGGFGGLGDLRDDEDGTDEFSDVDLGAFDAVEEVDEERAFS